ncbi:hypothetical protein [Vibrio harveyi]|nr:hypothetical protein [Vibrio harveyi]
MTVTKFEILCDELIMIIDELLGERGRNHVERIDDIIRQIDEEIAT